MFIIPSRPVKWMKQVGVDTHLWDHSQIMELQGKYVSFLPCCIIKTPNIIHTDTTEQVPH